MWAVRIFKTRTIAAEACKKGRITINGSLVKAARMIKPGDVIQVKKPPITFSFKVLQPIEKRVGAKLVSAKTGRHTFATIYLRKTKDLSSLQKLLGHSNIRETMIYAHVMDESKREGMQCFNSFTL